MISEGELLKLQYRIGRYKKEKIIVEEKLNSANDKLSEVNIIIKELNGTLTKNISQQTKIDRIIELSKID